MSPKIIVTASTKAWEPDSLRNKFYGILLKITSVKHGGWKNKTVSKLRITYIKEFDVGPFPEFSKPETLNMGPVSDGLEVCSPNQAEAQQSVHAAGRTEVRVCPGPSLRGTFYHVVTRLGQEPTACVNSCPFPVQENNALLRCVEKRLWKPSVICLQGDQDDRAAGEGSLGCTTFLPSYPQEASAFSQIGTI